MRYILLLFAFLVLLASCAAVPPPERPVAVESTADSPCNDSLYVVLKAKSMESMTEREYAYFMQKDRDCSEWQKGHDQVAAIDRAGNNATKWAMGAIFISFILAGVVAIVAQ